MADLLQQITAARKLLAQCKGTRMEAGCASQQCKLLLAGVRKLGPKDAVVLADASELIKEAGFPPADENALIEAIAAAGAGGIGPSGQEQDYCNLIFFLTAALWELLSSEDGPTELCNHLRALGLVKPTEYTLQVMSISLMIATEGIMAASKFSVEAKNGHMKFVRRWWEATKPGDVETPPIECWTLPREPEIFKNLHPELYEAAFATEPPVDCQISQSHIIMMKQGNWCRLHKEKPGSKRSSSSTASSSTALQFDMPSRSPSMPEAVAECMKQTLQTAVPLILKGLMEHQSGVNHGITINEGIFLPGQNRARHRSARTRELQDCVETSRDVDPLDLVSADERALDLQSRENRDPLELLSADERALVLQSREKRRRSEQAVVGVESVPKIRRSSKGAVVESESSSVGEPLEATAAVDATPLAPPNALATAVRKPAGSRPSVLEATQGILAAITDKKLGAKEKAAANKLSAKKKAAAEKAEAQTGASAEVLKRPAADATASASVAPMPAPSSGAAGPSSSEESDLARRLIINHEKSISQFLCRDKKKVRDGGIASKASLDFQARDIEFFAALPLNPV